MDKHEKFLEFNGRKVFFLNADGQWWIALKPICEALGVSWKDAHDNLVRDPLLASTIRQERMVAGDRKPRMMVCLPERYVYGWLFRIKSNNPDLLGYQRTCYDLLFQHFHGVITGRTEAIREKVLALREMEAIRKDLAMDERYKRLQELQGVVLHQSKTLKEADSAIEREQLQLFAEQN